MIYHAVFAVTLAILFLLLHLLDREEPEDNVPRS